MTVREGSYSATHGWLYDLTRVVDHGRLVSPRGRDTVELLGFSSTLVDMSYPVVVSRERKLGYKFMAAEAAWILSGDNLVETIRPFSKDIANFSDDGATFAGAYGPKVVDQFEYVVETLLKDPSSRQAVLSIWREKPGPSKDVPCTLSAQFMVRDGLLHCVDTMRSSDLWLGHVYDVFNFSMLSACVAVALRSAGLDVDLGGLSLVSGSKHIYRDDFDRVRKVLLDHSFTGHDIVDVYPGPRVDVSKFKTPDQVVAHLWALAESGKVAEQLSWDA